jgi:hypothetical protein
MQSVVYKDYPPYSRVKRSRVIGVRKVNRVWIRCLVKLLGKRGRLLRLRRGKECSIREYFIMSRMEVMGFVIFREFEGKSGYP